MQQLYLIGTHAAELADRLFTALNIRPAGYRLQPFAVEGALRGDAMHPGWPAALWRPLRWRRGWVRSASCRIFVRCSPGC